tara:strand:+ start:493 stop:672 length:180 start_codon:yes stop_codon:yes gene_type:complete
MAYRIEKPSIMSSVGTVYYKGDNVWDETFDNRKLYDTEADAKAEPYIWRWEHASVVDEG